MITYKEAQSQINSLAKSFGTETIELDDALGRVLAVPINADRDYPPFNRCAMDGYAIRLKDFDAGLREFEIIEIIYAGQTFEKGLSAGECYKIMTGAAVPLSSDAVIRKEDVEEKNKKVLVGDIRCSFFQNIAKQGQDILQGVNIINPPYYCDAKTISLLASLGKQRVIVERLPKIAVFTTGNEVMPVDYPVSAVQIRNSNSYLIKSLLQQKGIKPIICEHILDEKADLSEAFNKALNFNILIISGGVSAGDADFVPEVLEKLGVQKLFHKVSIKPGKPFWCGQLPNGGLVFALPGNPLSCLVTFSLFIEPFLRVSSGLKPQPIIKLPFNGTKTKNNSLDEFFPVIINEQKGLLEPVQINGSGDIRLGLNANAFGYHPAEIETIKPNSLVEYYRL